MAKRVTKVDLEAQARQLSKENGILSQALNALLNERPDDEQVWHGGPEDETSHYRALLFRSTWAHGGVVLVTYRHPGQADHTVAYYFDDWHEGVLADRPGNLAEQLAAGRLLLERDRRFEVQRARGLADEAAHG